MMNTLSSMSKNEKLVQFMKSEVLKHHISAKNELTVKVNLDSARWLS